MAKSREIDKLLQQKNERLDSVPNKLSERVIRAQKELLYEVRLLLEQFERNGDYITTSAQNIRLVNELKDKLQQLLYRSEYAKAIREFAQEIDKQADINSAFYKASVSYSESAITAALIDSAKKTAVDTLLGGAMDSVFYAPVVDAINQAVSTNAGFTETVKALEIAIEGGEVNGAKVDGRLERYVKQIASDSFAITDRTYNNQVSDELELEFFRYTGGLLETSREFCIARNGNYYHEKEIETWIDGGGDDESNPEPNVEWPGQYRGTNSSTIYSVCGGYNCKHTLMPVPIEGVPVDVIRRNMESGNIKLSDKQREILGV